MFRDTEQRARVCNAVMGRTRAGQLFDVPGGYDVASGDDVRGSLSSGESVLFELAVDLWNWAGGAKVVDLFRLDPKTQLFVFSLLIAISQGGKVVDSWLSEHAANEHEAVSW